MTPLEGLQAAVLGPRGRKIIDALSRAYPSYLDGADLQDKVFADEPDGGPIYANQALTEAIRTLRPEIERFGWTIPKAKPHAGYRLQPMGRR